MVTRKFILLVVFLVLTVSGVGWGDPPREPKYPVGEGPKVMGHELSLYKPTYAPPKAGDFKDASKQGALALYGAETARAYNQKEIEKWEQKVKDDQAEAKVQKAKAKTEYEKTLLEQRIKEREGDLKTLEKEKEAQKQAEQDIENAKKHLDAVDKHAKATEALAQAEQNYQQAKADGYKNGAGPDNAEAVNAESKVSQAQTRVEETAKDLAKTELPWKSGDSQVVEEGPKTAAKPTSETGGASEYATANTNAEHHRTAQEALEKSGGDPENQVAVDHYNRQLADNLKSGNTVKGPEVAPDSHAYKVQNADAFEAAQQRSGPGRMTEAQMKNAGVSLVTPEGKTLPYDGVKMVDGIPTHTWKDTQTGKLTAWKGANGSELATSAPVHNNSGSLSTKPLKAAAPVAMPPTSQQTWTSQVTPPKPTRSISSSATSGVSRGPSSSSQRSGFFARFFGIFRRRR